MLKIGFLDHYIAGTIGAGDLQPAAAELIYERAAVDKDWAYEAYTGLTRLRAAQGRYEAALESVNQALRIQPDPDLEAYRVALERTLEASR